MKSTYNNNNNNNFSSNVRLLYVLQIIFIVLKMTNLVSWTWVQVFIPTFIGLAIGVLAIIAIFIITWVHKKTNFNRSDKN